MDSMPCAVESCAWLNLYSAGRCVGLGSEWARIPSCQWNCPETTQMLEEKKKRQSQKFKIGF